MTLGSESESPQEVIPEQGNHRDKKLQECCAKYRWKRKANNLKIYDHYQRTAIFKEN